MRVAQVVCAADASSAHWGLYTLNENGEQNPKLIFSCAHNINPFKLVHKPNCTVFLIHSLFYLSSFGSETLTSLFSESYPLLRFFVRQIHISDVKYIMITQVFQMYQKNQFCFLINHFLFRQTLKSNNVSLKSIWNFNKPLLSQQTFIKIPFLK